MYLLPGARVLLFKKYKDKKHSAAPVIVQPEGPFSGIAADRAQHSRGGRDILLAVEPVRNRRAANSGAGLIRPQWLSIDGVISMKVAFSIAGKNPVASRGEHSRGHRRAGLNLPGFLPGLRGQPQAYRKPSWVDS